MDSVFASFQSLPICTRTWLGCTLLVTVAVSMDVVRLDQVLFDWKHVVPTTLYHYIMTRMTDDHRSLSSSLSSSPPEFWRFLTTFCYAGKLEIGQFETVFLLFTMYMFSKGYEENPFPIPAWIHAVLARLRWGGQPDQHPHDHDHDQHRRTIDTLVAGVCMSVFLVLTQGIPGAFQSTYRVSPILTRSFASAWLYLWSKRNPYIRIQLNFIPMAGRYLPFAHLGLALLLHNRIHELLHGFVIAHVYYFGIVVAPVTLLRARMTTPRTAPTTHTTINTIHPPPAEEGATLLHVYAKIGNLQKLREYVPVPVPDRTGNTTTTNNNTSTNNNNNNNITDPSAGTTTNSFDVQDTNGWTPLHEAVRGGYLPIVRYLVEEHKAKLTTHTKTGQSPLQLSQHYHRGHHGTPHPVTIYLQERLLANQQQQEQYPNTSTNTRNSTEHDSVNDFDYEDDDDNDGNKP